MVIQFATRCQGPLRVSEGRAPATRTCWTPEGQCTDARTEANDATDTIDREAATHGQDRLCALSGPGRRVPDDVSPRRDSPRRALPRWADDPDADGARLHPGGAARQRLG